MLPMEFQSNEETPVDESVFADENVEEQELQEVGQRDLHTLPEHVDATDSVDGGMGNGSIVKGDSEKLREDQNHERTSNDIPGSPKVQEEFEMSPKHDVGEV